MDDSANMFYITSDYKNKKNMKVASSKNTSAVSSIVKWGYQDNFNPVYFFTKIFCAYKNTHKQILTNKTKLSEP